MNTAFAALIGGFAPATASALMKGLTAFLRDAKHTRLNEDASAETLGVKQNRMMSPRVLF